MKTLINGATSSYDAHEPTFQHSLWECWVSLMRHNTPVGRHYSHQIWAAAVKSVMNLSAGLVSATQSRAPPQLHWLSLCTAQGHGLCSEHRDRCGNYLNWWRRKKKKASAFQECHTGWVCVGRLWVGFSDSRVDVKGFKHFSPLLILSCHYPTHQPTHPLICPWFPTGEEKEDGRAETRWRSREVCGQASLVRIGQWVGWPRGQWMLS